MMLRVIIDTQLFLRAAINPRSLPSKILTQFNSAYELINSSETRAEVADVLNRPELRRKFSTLTDERTSELLALIDAANLVDVIEIPPTSRDPKDDKFLAAAQASDADYLVSEDNDLLTLKSFGRTRIVNALDFLQILSAMPPDES